MSDESEAAQLAGELSTLSRTIEDTEPPPASADQVVLWPAMVGLANAVLGLMSRCLIAAAGDASADRS